MELTGKLGSLKAFLTMMAAACAVALFAALPQAAWAATVVKDAAGFEAAVSAGGEIALDGNIQLEGEVSITKDVDIDLGGYTLAAKSGSWGLTINGATASIDNGTIEGDSGLVRVEKGANVSLGSGANLYSSGGSCVVIINNSTITTSATLKTDSKFGAIQGDGSEGNGGATVNVTGGELWSERGVAAYFPNTTSLNISGGLISGYSAVYVKSGNLNITGGKLFGTGKAVSYAYSPSGCSATGDAVIIEACDYPGGVPTVSISSGYFKSYEGLDVGYYRQNDDYRIANEKFVTGGTFNNPRVGKYVADDKAVMINGLTLVVVDKTKALAECDWCVSIEGVTFYTSDARDLEGFGNAVLYGATFKYVTADGVDTFSKVYVPFGSVVEEGDIPTVPARDGYEFTGWDKDTSMEITAPTTFTATYREAAETGGNTDGGTAEPGDGKDDEDAGAEPETAKCNDSAIAQTGDAVPVIAVCLLAALAAAGVFAARRRMQ